MTSIVRPRKVVSVAAALFVVVIAGPAQADPTAGNDFFMAVGGEPSIAVALTPSLYATGTTFGLPFPSNYDPVPLATFSAAANPALFDGWAFSTTCSDPLQPCNGSWQGRAFPIAADLGYPSVTLAGDNALAWDARQRRLVSIDMCNLYDEPLVNGVPYTGGVTKTVCVAFSTDGGQTFSPAKPVNFQPAIPHGDFIDQPHVTVDNLPNSSCYGCIYISGAHVGVAMKVWQSMPDDSDLGSGPARNILALPGPARSRIRTGAQGELYVATRDPTNHLLVLTNSSTLTDPFTMPTWQTQQVAPDPANPNDPAIPYAGAVASSFQTSCNTINQCSCTADGGTNATVNVLGCSCVRDSSDPTLAFDFANEVLYYAYSAPTRNGNTFSTLSSEILVHRIQPTYHTSNGSVLVDSLLVSQPSQVAALPANPPKYQAQPALALGSLGELLVSWLEVPQSGLGFDIRFAVSQDLVPTFGPAASLYTGPPVNDLTVATFNGCFLGDYFSGEAANGNYHVAWTDPRSRIAVASNQANLVIQGNRILAATLPPVLLGSPQVSQSAIAPGDTFSINTTVTIDADTGTGFSGGPLSQAVSIYNPFSFSGFTSNVSLTAPNPIPTLSGGETVTSGFSKPLQWTFQAGTARGWANIVVGAGGTFQNAHHAVAWKGKSVCIGNPVVDCQGSHPFTKIIDCPNGVADCPLLGIGQTPIRIKLDGQPTPLDFFTSVTPFVDGVQQDPSVLQQGLNLRSYGSGAHELRLDLELLQGITVSITQTVTVVADMALAAGSQPWGCTSGPDENIWFAEWGANKVGRIYPSGAIDEFTVPTTNGGPYGITMGPDDNIWFTEVNSGKIGRIRNATGPASGVIVEDFVIDSLWTAWTSPSDIKSDTLGNLWVAGYGSNRIYKISGFSQSPFSQVAPTVSEYQVPTGTVAPEQLAIGPDNRIWFTEYSGQKLGLFDPSTSTFSEPVTFPLYNAFPYGMTFGPDGNIWVAELGGHQVAKVSPTPPYSLTEYSTGTHAPAYTLSYGGNVWFTEFYGDKIGKMSTDGTFTEISIPNSPANPSGICAGPDGKIWYSEYSGNSIGYVTP